MPFYYPALWQPFYATLFPSPKVHLGLFVHRVNGLIPGLYALIRDPFMVNKIQEEWKNNNYAFAWKKVDDSLDLYLLVEGDCQEIAKQLSCAQDIAADCTFSFGMISQFEDTLVEKGPIAYKHLHWEAGYLAHIMYLEAEAMQGSTKLRATGMGCYFDEPVHSLFCESDDLTNMKWQSLYHFTLGGPVEDKRILSISKPEQLYQ